MREVYAQPHRREQDAHAGFARGEATKRKALQL